MILFREMDDPERIKERMENVMSSDDAFYVEMRECLADVFDTDRDQPPVSFPEPLMDYHMS